MPIHGYPGNVITANPTAPTSTVATGVWTTEQQLQATAAGNWPFTIPTQQISRGLRFNPADTAYLNRTLGTSNRRTFTFSAWVKRSLLASDQHLLGAINFAGGGSTNQQFGILFQGGEYLNVFHYNNGTYQYYPTAALYRDPSAWYHVVVGIDTTQATGSNRAKIYVNGVLQATNGAVDFTQNTDLFINCGFNTGIGTQVGTGLGNSYYFGGYMAEVYFIDGQQLTPSSFGRTSTTTGVWEPLAYTGTYGTNGFYLNFSDNSGTTSTTLGKDSSGNGNNWTPNNFSVTAGAGNDSMVDSPTAYGTDTGVGGEVRGNYCTLNPLQSGTTNITYSNGNLTASQGNTTAEIARGTIALPTTGKWYWEATITSTSPALPGIGIINTANTSSALAAGVYTYTGVAGSSYSNGSFVTYGATFTNGDVIGVAFDADAGTLVFYKNNSSQGTFASSLTATYAPAMAVRINGTSGSFDVNFGQRAFAYTAPSGFKALCTTNLPTPTIGATSTTQAGKYFNAVVYTGTGSAQSITGVGFQPDFIWLKNRTDAATNHGLWDAIRGNTLRLVSNLTDAETSTTAFTFASDGFDLTGAGYNTSAKSFISWNWNAGGSNATNTSGTITSTVRANTTSGFSIVQWTGSGANGTVGHGLGVAPQFMFMKNKTNSGTGWPSYHAFMDASAPQNYYISMASTDAKTSASNAWNNTAPTSSVFSVGSSSFSNGGTMIAYVFAPVAGYSAFGSYGSNNSLDNAFVYCGFRPRWIMIKSATTGGTNYDWLIFDTVRMSYNYIANTDLRANLATSEGGTARNPKLDILSNGFKVRDSSGEIGSSTTYIFAAFAETPFKYALAR
jgi:hypothetical protein